MGVAHRSSAVRTSGNARNPLCIAGLMALAAMCAVAFHPAKAEGRSPLIEILPAMGPCRNSVAVRGVDLEPYVTYVIWLESSRTNMAPLARVTTGSNGEFVVGLEPFPVGVDCDRGIVTLRVLPVDPDSSYAVGELESRVTYRVQSLLPPRTGHGVSGDRADESWGVVVLSFAVLAVGTWIRVCSRDR